MRKLDWPVSTVLLGLMAMILPAAGQSTVGVRFQTNFATAEFYVDGAKYLGQASFLWPEGTKHMIEIRRVDQPDDSGTTRLKFTGFTDNQTLLMATGSPIQQMTVDSHVTSYAMAFQREYRVDYYINYQPLDSGRLAAEDRAGCTFANPFVSPVGFITSFAGTGLSCGTGVGGNTVTSGSEWATDGTVKQLGAFAYPGYVFAGWDRNSSLGAAYLNQVKVDRPLVIRAIFEAGRRHYLYSSPQAGLKVRVDRGITATRTPSGKCYAAEDEPVAFPPAVNSLPPTSPQNPTMPAYGPGSLMPLCDGDRDFLAGTQVLLAAPVSQTTITGKMWIFDQWDLGNGQTGGQNTLWTVPDDWTPHSLTAKFVPGLRASFVTLPTNLKLKIDGRDNWQYSNFEWGIGHKHTVEAPLEQLDARGRRYRFVGWSNGGPATQELILAEDPTTPNSFRMVATYEILGQLTLSSDPSSISAVVDGAECKLPCTTDGVVGTEVSISVAPDMALSPDTKVVFDGWTDGSQALSRTVKLSADQIALRAKYRYVHKMRAISDPEGGALWQFDPVPEAGNYFKMGTRVEVTAVAQPGHKFRRWEGALSGPYNVGWVTMNTPQTVVARLDKVPALTENAVRNAAGDTPDKVVAPGSLISIGGYNLAPGSEKGPANPLRQTMQGVVVQVNSRILPLVSVAPEEIIAQLPSDFVEGEYTLTVRSSGQAPLFGKFLVARNAPGLFRKPDSVEDTPLAVAFHEDGKEVTADNPAQTGETISILGTGFGPVEPAPLDGFAVPAAPPAALKDSLEAVVSGEVRPVIWSGAAPGMVGYSLVKVQVDSTMGQNQNLEFKVRINGRESNPVLLPLQ